MDFNTQLHGFLDGVQKEMDAYFLKSATESGHMVKLDDGREVPLQGRKLVIMQGQRYVRIVAKDIWKGELVETSGSAWAFIDTTNGDILFCAGWKAPAKHPRGNIMEEGFGVKYVLRPGSWPAPRALR